jgi:hypothetical protein
LQVHWFVPAPVGAQLAFASQPPLPVEQEFCGVQVLPSPV